MRWRVTFEQSVPVQDGTGDPELQWLPLCTVAAEVVPQRSREVVGEGNQILPVNTTLFRVRHSTQTARVTERHRILFKGKPYGILGIRNINQRSRQLEFTCEQGRHPD